MTEAEKALPHIAHLLEGKRVLDLGCGDKKVVPWAVGVDDCSEHKVLKPDIVARAGSIDQFLLIGKLESRGLPTLGGWDVVVSSHLLEHLDNPILENLRWWFDLVKKGGLLLVFIPNEREYKYVLGAPLARNPAHKHLLVPEVVRWSLDQITGAKIVVEQAVDYSTLFVVEKP